MTRRGCGCCKSCKEDSALFNQDFYAPKSVRTLNSRTFTLKETVYLNVVNYDPSTGKKTSDTDEVVYENETPYSDEYMGVADTDGVVFIGSGELNAISFLHKRITVRDDNGNRTQRRSYTSYLSVRGNHTSKAAIEYDLSDGHDFGVDNKYGYKRLAGTILDITYSSSKVPASDRADSPAIELASGYSADNFGGFDRAHRVVVQNHSAGSGQSAQDGSGLSIYGFTSSESAPETKEELLSLIESAGDPINTTDEVPEDILENGTEDRPNVAPGLEGKYDLELTRIEPDGPVDGKSFLILESDDMFIRTGATIRSYFQPRVVTPVHTVFGQIESETTGRDYEEIYRDTLQAVNHFGDQLEKVNVFSLRGTAGVLDNENWRNNGWKKIGSNHYEHTKKIKPNTQVDFSELVPKDFFSFNTRDYGIEDRGNKLTVEFFDSKNDYVFSQTFERGTQLLSRDVESKETFTLAGVKFSKFGYDMDGTSQRYRGLINGNFDGAKYFTSDNDYQETPFYLYGYKEGIASRTFHRGEVGYTGFSGESLYSPPSGPEAGVYRVNGDGLLKFNNIDFFNNTLNQIEQGRIHNGIITPKIPVKDSGLVYFPEKYYRPTPTKFWSIDPSTGFSVTDGLGFGYSGAFGYGVDSSFQASENWDQVDYVDDLARYYIKTEGSFGSGSVLSLSENANNSFLFSVNLGGTYRRSLILGSNSRDQMTLPAGLQTVMRAALSSGKKVYLDSDPYSWQQSNAWIKTPVRTRQSLDAINARRDISNEKLQEYLQDMEGSEQYVNIQWTQTLMSCYSSYMPTPSPSQLLSNPYTHLTFRFRESHAEIGSLHEINLKTFDPSSGNRWRYKPSAWPEDYSFKGFTSMRFKIESDDCVPYKYSQIGTSDWESLPDHTESGHDNKYIQHQRCAQSECYYLAPYSTLNYKIDNIDFAGTSFELCEETGSSYSGCSVTLVHSLSEHMANSYNDAGVICSRSVVVDRASYQASNANSVNSGSYGQKISMSGTARNMPFVSSYNNVHTDVPDSIYAGYFGSAFDMEGYNAKELYYTGKTLFPKLQDSQASVETIAETDCRDGEPSCVTVNTVDYTVDGNAGDLGYLAIVDVERGSYDSVTSENGADCSYLDDAEVLKSVTYIQTVSEPADRLLHHGAYFSSTDISSYCDWSGSSDLGNKLGVELNIRVDIELEDPDNEVGPISSRTLVGDLRFETLSLEYSADEGSFSSPELIGDKMSLLVGSDAEGLGAPSSLNPYCYGADCYDSSCSVETVIAASSGTFDECEYQFTFPKPQFGLLYEDGEDNYSQYYTDLSQEEYDPPKQKLDIYGNHVGDISRGPYSITGEPASLDVVGSTYSESMSSQDTSAIHASVFYRVAKSFYTYGFSVDLGEDFNPLEPEDLQIRLGDHDQESSYDIGSLTSLDASYSEENSESSLGQCHKDLFEGQDKYYRRSLRRISLQGSNGIGSISIDDITINLTKREY